MSRAAVGDGLYWLCMRLIFSDCLRSCCCVVGVVSCVILLPCIVPTCVYVPKYIAGAYCCYSCGPYQVLHPFLPNPYNSSSSSTSKFSGNVAGNTLVSICPMPTAIFVVNVAHGSSCPSCRPKHGGHATQGPQQQTPTNGETGNSTSTNARTVGSAVGDTSQSCSISHVCLPIERRHALTLLLMPPSRAVLLFCFTVVFVDIPTFGDATKLTPSAKIIRLESSLHAIRTRGITARICGSQHRLHFALSQGSKTYQTLRL